MYFTFENPEFLLYMLSIPLLIASHFAFLKYRKRKALRFANFQALKRVSEERVLTKNYTLLFIRILILTAIIFSIVGTKIWYIGLTTNNDYVLVIDSSSSMSAQDLTPSRLEAAKDYSKLFLQELQSDSKIGLVTFSGAAFIEHIPTKDKDKIRDSITSLEIAHVGGTNIPDAIITSTNLLLNSEKGKTIILMTDGSNTVGYFTSDPIEQGIKYAKQYSVIVNTIALGTNSGPIGYLPEAYNVQSVADESTLMRISNATGGKHYTALDNAAMDSAIKDIVSNSTMAYIGLDLTSGLLILALAFIFLEWGLISTRFRGLP